MTEALIPPLKWHGGKNAFNGKLAKWIISKMPPRNEWLHYVEPFFGGGGVLLYNNPNGISEVVNDLDGDLTNFWQVLSSDDFWNGFYDALQVIPFSEENWTASGIRLKAESILRSYDRIGYAVAFFIRCRQSLAGRMKSFAPLSKTRTRGGMNEQVSAWLNAVGGLPAVHARLKRVAIVGPKDAKLVIKEQDGPKTIQYLDPPYMDCTRKSKKVYAKEMTEKDHIDLLELITSNGMESRFMISGYRCSIYDELLKSWTRHDFEIANNSAGGKTKRRMVESLWCNF